MSSEVLHEAAKSIRADNSPWHVSANCDHPDCEHIAFMCAVADLLDHAAKFASWRTHVGDGPTADLIDEATKAARAYLGGVA